MKEFESLGLSEISVISDGWFRILAQHKRDVKYASDSGQSRRIVAVFGSSTIKEGTNHWQMAQDLGREVAARGGIVMNGGYGGIMEALAKGAREAGGVTIGVTCENLPEKSPNQFITNEWKVERWDQRLLALVWLADAYAVCVGSSGTLVELSMVVETQLKGFIPPRPIICVGGFWRAVVQMIGDAHPLIKFANTPA